MMPKTKILFQWLVFLVSIPGILSSVGDGKRFQWPRNAAQMLLNPKTNQVAPAAAPAPAPAAPPATTIKPITTTTTTTTKTTVTLTKTTTATKEVTEKETTTTITTESTTPTTATTSARTTTLQECNPKELDSRYSNAGNTLTHWYVEGEEVLTYEEAKTFCEDRAAHLVYFKDSDGLEAILHYMGNTSSNIWTGLKSPDADVSCEGTATCATAAAGGKLQWSDGETFQGGDFISRMVLVQDGVTTCIYAKNLVSVAKIVMAEPSSLFGDGCNSKTAIPLCQYEC